jgi:hypothetical protein
MKIRFIVSFKRTLYDDSGGRQVCYRWFSGSSDIQILSMVI